MSSIWGSDLDWNGPALPNRGTLSISRSGKGSHGNARMGSQGGPGACLSRGSETPSPGCPLTRTCGSALLMAGHVPGVNKDLCVKKNVMLSKQFLLDFVHD